MSCLWCCPFRIVWQNEREWLFVVSAVCRKFGVGIPDKINHYCHRATIQICDLDVKARWEDHMGDVGQVLCHVLAKIEWRLNNQPTAEDQGRNARLHQRVRAFGPLRNGDIRSGAGGRGPLLQARMSGANDRMPVAVQGKLAAWQSLPYP